ncbi:MAG: hypothetical protein IJ733_09615, partial [Lachnospiraceae bacterium]|nr:hypothetical protein [Lachnospiraceae bacterium]
MNTVQWIIFLVLLYFMGSLLLIFSANVSWGILILHGIIILAALWFCRKNSRWRRRVLLSFAVITMALWPVPEAMRMQMVLQEYLFVGSIFYLTWHEGFEKSALSYCHISRLSLFQIPLIIVETFLLIIVTGYINACSMLFFTNTVEDTL